MARILAPNASPKRQVSSRESGGLGRIRGPARRWRVSTRDQNPDAQRDALAAAGSDQVFIDTASGKLARRPELDRALQVGRAGDQLVVTKLDRLGRSLEHLIDLSKGLQVMRWGSQALG